MKINSKSAVVIPAVLAVAWVLIMLILCGFAPTGPIQPFALGFGLLAFAAVIGVVLLLTEGTKGKEVPSYGPIAAYSGTFLFLAIALNTVFLFLKPDLLAFVFWIANIFLLALYLILAFTSFGLIRTTEHKAAAAASAVKQTSVISAQISGLMNICDAGVRKELAGLKEAVDYSTNTTGRYTSVIEKEMLEKLAIIGEAIRQGESDESVRSLIGEASIIWKNRNTSLS